MHLLRILVLNKRIPHPGGIQPYVPSPTEIVVIPGTEKSAHWTPSIPASSKNGIKNPNAESTWHPI